MFTVKIKGVTVPYLPAEDSVKGLYIEIAKCLTCVRGGRLFRKHTQVHLLSSNILAKLGGGLGKTSVVKVARREQADLCITGTEIEVGGDRR